MRRRLHEGRDEELYILPTGLEVGCSIFAKVRNENATGHEMGEALADDTPRDIHLANMHGRLPRVTLQEAEGFHFCVLPLSLPVSSASSSSTPAPLHLCMEMNRGYSRNPIQAPGVSRSATCISLGTGWTDPDAWTCSPVPLMELGVGPFHLDVWLAVSNDLRLLAGTVRSVEGGLVSATFMAVGSKILRADLARTTALFHAKDAGLMEEAGRGRRRDLARQWELARHGEGGGEGGDDHVNMSRSADLRCDKGCVTKLDQLALKRSTRGGVLPVWLHHELDNTTAAGLVFSIYGSAGHGHDANMCITRGGIVLAALECERFFNQRYFTFGGLAGNVFETQLREVFSQLLRMASIKGHAADVVFEVGLYATSLVDPSALAVLRRVVQAKAWFDFNHHMAHAAIGFFGSPFTKALVLSYDGGGNDGNFNSYFRG